MNDSVSFSSSRIARVRLRAQCIEPPAHGSSCESSRAVVAHLGALQGQDYAGALWSIGLRVPGSTLASVEAAFANREIVRTWPMRGTLHVIPAADARWMLELLTPRVLALTARRREQLGLDEPTLLAAARVCTDALRGGNRLTREEMMALLDGAGIATAGQRGYHILFDLSMRRLILFGPRQGTQQTFVLFDEWLPDAPVLPAAEALATIVSRFFTSHGPATVKDFAGWSGLTMADTRTGLAANSDVLSPLVVDGIEYWMPSATATRLAEDVEADGAGEPAAGPQVHLLPGFDEFILGYKDRSAFLRADHSELIVPGGNGVFRPTVIVDGRVAGVWKRVTRKGRVSVEATPFAAFTAAQLRAIEDAAARYLAFLGLESG